MWDLEELKKTRVYQEAKEEGRLEGKLETVPYFLSLGAGVEQTAEMLTLEVEAVRKVAQQQPSSN